MTANAGVLLAKVIRREPEALGRAVAQGAETLFGRRASVELLKVGGPSLAALFGGRRLFVFPLRDERAAVCPAFLTMDATAAVRCAAACASLPSTQVKMLLASGAVPNPLRQALGQAASALCAAASAVVRARKPQAAELLRGPVCKEIAVGPWPALLVQFSPRAPWEIVACRLIVAGEKCGAILFAASDGRRADTTGESADTAAASGEGAATAPVGDGPVRTSRPKSEAPPDRYTTGGCTSAARPDNRAPQSNNSPPQSDNSPPQARAAQTCVLVMGQPTDPATAWLETSLKEAGTCVLAGVAALVRSGRHPDALFVVSRSPTDLAARLASALAGGRPAMVVACSDWPTQDMVVAARNAGVDEFLVLPAATERLRSILDRALAPEETAGDRNR